MNIDEARERLAEFVKRRPTYPDDAVMMHADHTDMIRMGHLRSLDAFLRTSPSEKALSGPRYLVYPYDKSQTHPWFTDNPSEHNGTEGNCDVLIDLHTGQKKTFGEWSPIERHSCNETPSVFASTACSGWIACSDRMPEDETPALIIRNGEIRIGELRWEKPSFEETFQAFRYWDDPQDDGQAWEHHEITHWQPLPAFPSSLASSAKDKP